MKRSRKLVQDNPRQVFRILLKRLGYPYSRELYDAMFRHPDFPSFLSFHYVLKRIGINNAALRIGYDDLVNKIPMPALVHVTTNVEIFLVVEKASDDGIYVLNEKGEQELIAKDEFLKMWEGNVLMVDTDNIPKTPQKKARQKMLNFLAVARNPFIIISAVCLLFFLIHISGYRSCVSWLFLLIYSIGIAVSVVLLVGQFDKHNAFVKKLCTSKKEESKRNCSSILDSKDAYFIGLFSWSDIGFVYFVALFIVTLLLPDEGVVVAVFTSLFAFGYVFYSVLYQKFVARSWCTLCLAVQAVLTMLFLLSIFTIGRQVDMKLLLQLPLIAAVLAIGIAVIAGYAAAKPLMQAKIDEPSLVRAYKLLKNEDDVKNLLLDRQMSTTTNGINTVRVGNPDASTCITMAFGPMCQPCMEELRTLIPFLKTKSDTLFELLFIFDRKNGEEAFSIARHLLKNYLDSPDTFLNTLERYAIRYPISRYEKRKPIGDGDTRLIDEMLDRHETWRKANKIHSTPVIFLNHKRLPSIYSIQDLDYMCE